MISGPFMCLGTICAAIDPDPIRSKRCESSLLLFRLQPPLHAEIIFPYKSNPAQRDSEADCHCVSIDVLEGKAYATQNTASAFCAAIIILSHPTPFVHFFTFFNIFQNANKTVTYYFTACSIYGCNGARNPNQLGPANIGGRYSLMFTQPPSLFPISCTQLLPAAPHLEKLAERIKSDRGNAQVLPFPVILTFSSGF